MRTAPATRAPSKAPVKENPIHMTVAGFLRHAWPEHLPWWHTPNGERRDKRTAAKLKAMGVLPGVPDFTFILPNGQAAFIELKTPPGDHSDGQLDLRAKLIALRCGYATCRSADDAERVLSAWLAKFGLSLRASLAARAPTNPKRIAGGPHAST